MRNKFLTLATVAFPGGYKFFVVMIITLLSTVDVANQFSNMFFWITLLTTFTGLPLASILISKSFVISLSHKFTLVALFSIISLLVAYQFKLHKFDILTNATIFVSLFLLSIYEIYKRYFLNNGDFLNIFIASATTIVFFCFTFVFIKENAEFLIFLTFFSLVVPLLLIYKKNRQTTIDKDSKPTDFFIIFKAFLKYLFSNATSTSLMAVLPLIIINELGNEISASLAQVFYFSTLSYLFPRALSAKHIPKMRNEGVNKNDVKSFFINILLFVLLSSTISIVSFNFLFEEWVIFAMLFIAMQISQLALPFSNVLMVKGDVNKILKSNMLSSLVLILLSAVIFTIFTKGASRAQALLEVFILFQITKLVLSYFYARKNW